MEKKSNKKKIIKNKKKFIKTLCVVFAFIAVITSSLFVIDSFAPANPKCYDRFVLSTFNGSYNKKGLPKTSWEVKPVSDINEGGYATVFGKFYVQYETQSYTKEIWLNVSDFYNNSTKIIIGKGGGIESAPDKEKYTYTLNKKTVNNSSDGWIKIFDSEWEGAFDFTSRYVWVGFTNANIKIREIAFIGDDGELHKESNNIIDEDGRLYEENGKVCAFAGLNKSFKYTVDEYSLAVKRFKK